MSANALLDHTGLFETRPDILPNPTRVFGTHSRMVWYASQHVPLPGIL